MFSKRFFDIIFQKALNLIPFIPASEVVKIIKVFEDRADYLSQFTSKGSKFMEHIAQDMEKTSMEDLCYLIQLYSHDPAFSKYLLVNLLEKMR